MRADLSHALQLKLGPPAARLACTLPQGWRSSARRRRFLFLAACAPGFTAVAALPAHKNVWVLLAGTLAVVAAGALRRLSEPVLMLGGDHD
jgi:hypothetical protein